MKFEPTSFNSQATFLKKCDNDEESSFATDRETHFKSFLL